MNDTVEEILADLAAAMTTNITTYYQGYVTLPPKHALPCLQVYGITTTQTAKSTAKDQAVYVIGIRIVVDVTSKFTTAGTGVIIKAQKDIIDLMEERSTGGIAVADSVLGTLRRNIKGTDYLFNNDVEINYETIEKDGFFYSVAEMRLRAVTDLVLRQ